MVLIGVGLPILPCVVFFGCVPCLQEGCAVVMEVLLACCISDCTYDERVGLFGGGLVFAPCPRRFLYVHVVASWNGVDNGDCWVF